MLYRYFVYSALFVFLIIGLSCSEDHKIFQYEGEGGEEISFNFDDYVPVIPFAIAREPGSGSFVVDTGSPVNLVDIGHFDSESGIKTLDATGLGFFFPDLKMVFEDWTDDGHYIGGIIGVALLKHFNWEIDYPDQTITLFIDQIPEEATDVVDFDLAGGGRFRAVNGDETNIGPNRHLVQMKVEEESVLCLVDTGASFNVVSQSLMDKLGWQDRSDYGSVEVVTINGVVSAPLTEIYDLAFEQLPLKTNIKNTLTTIMDDKFFSSLCVETGRKIDALLGGTFLSNFKLVFSYSDRTIRIIKEEATKKSRKQLPGKMRFPFSTGSTII
ncbi:MAG: retroviral-like aspartic protease family protein [Myxococcota bacterium]